MKVYVIAFKGKSFTSKLIKYYQFGYPYTHIAYLHDIKDLCITEAWHLPLLQGGNVYHKVSIYDNHSKGTEFTIFSIDILPEQKAKIEDFLEKQKGKKYDYLGLLGFVIKKDYTNANNKWFCSELVFEAFKQAGVYLLTGVESWQVSPRDFLTSPLLNKEVDGKIL